MAALVPQWLYALPQHQSLPEPMHSAHHTGIIEHQSTHHRSTAHSGCPPSWKPGDSSLYQMKQGPISGLPASPKVQSYQIQWSPPK
jgi:hypothetical protein